MKSNNMRVIAASILIALAPAAYADDGGGRVAGVEVHQHGGPAARLAAAFTNLAGSRDNALALVHGLRNGTDIVLTTTTTKPATPPTTGTGTGTGTATTTDTTTTTTTRTTIDPATGKMGWGNVKIALALAQHTLAANGITRPTPEQLAAALNGGDLAIAAGTGSTATTRTVTLQGILAQRASGMGWGQIAKAEGTKVGAVLHEARVAGRDQVRVESEHRHGGRHAATSTSTPGTGTTSAASGAAKATTASGAKPAGLTTAAGGGSAHAIDAKSKGITTAAGGPQAASAKSKGIVTAAGGSQVAGARSKGIVTAGGATAGASHGRSSSGSGVVTAAGTAGAGVAATHAKAPATAGVVTAAGTTASAVTTAQGGSSSGHGNGKGQGQGGGKKG